MYSWLYQVGVSLCYPRTFRLTGPLSYCANASQKCVLTAPNAAISTHVFFEQSPFVDLPTAESRIEPTGLFLS